MSTASQSSVNSPDVFMAPHALHAAAAPDRAHTAGEELFTIGELAKLCDVTVRTLRYYEEMDLIAPVGRTSGKYRLYDARSIKRLQAIQTFQSLNYSLEQILVILGPYSRIETLEKGERIQNTRRNVAAQKAMVEAKLTALQEIRSELDHRLKVLSAQCDPCCAEKADTCHEGCELQPIHWS